MRCATHGTPLRRRWDCFISYDDWGFQLGDGVDVRGSIIALPNSYVLWQPKRVADVTIESLRVVELVKPKIGEC